jgi:hypothetical protein
MTDWQCAQAAKCPCRGSDDMCPCQNVSPRDRELEPFRAAERALLGQRWSQEQAERLIELVKIGAVPTKLPE